MKSYECLLKDVKSEKFNYELNGDQLIIDNSHFKILIETAVDFNRDYHLVTLQNPKGEKIGKDLKIQYWVDLVKFVKACTRF